MTINNTRKLILKNKWDIQLNKLLKTYLKYGDKKKMIIYNRLSRINTEIRDLAIDHYYKKTKRDYNEALLNWAKSVKESESTLNNIQLSKSPNKAKFEEHVNKSKFIPVSRNSYNKPMDRENLKTQYTIEIKPHVKLSTNDIQGKAKKSLLTKKSSIIPRTPKAQGSRKTETLRSTFGIPRPPPSQKRSSKSLMVPK